MKRKSTLLGVLLLLFAFAGTGCGMKSTEANEIGLVYSGGVVENKKFKGFLQPGATRDRVGWGSKVYRYRIDQRSYIANAKNQQADERPVEIVSKDGVRLATDYAMYFKLNRDEKVLRQFHENLGVKTEAWTEDGWVQLLREYFAPHIERSMEAAGLQFNMRELRSSEEVRKKFQDLTISNLKTAVKEVVGGEYFCGPSYNGPGTECGSYTFTVGKPEPVNPAIVEAIEAEQTNVARTLAQEQENARINKELEIERQIIAMYGPDGALLREAIKSGKVSQFIIDNAGRSTTNPNRSQ